MIDETKVSAFPAVVVPLPETAVRPVLSDLERQFTEIRTEHLPTVVPSEDEAVEEVAEAAAVEFLPVLYDEGFANQQPLFTEDTYVPPDIEQRLLVYWLQFGPDYAQQMVMQAPVQLPDEIPIINPLARQLGALVGARDDGTLRMLRPKR